MIDVRLKNGDILKEALGRAELLSGRDAAFQRAKIRMNVRKGSFIYDRSLGVETEDRGLERRELVMSEALADMENAAVKLLDENRVRLIIDGEERIEEVRFYGEI